jgi:hypothetical protein
MIPINGDSESNMQRSRLVSLIEFSHEAARLRSAPVSSVSKHGMFSVFEEDVLGLPGVRFNTTSHDGKDEVWLSIERLRETRPPIPTSPILQPWVQISPSPSIEPKLIANLDGKSLVEARTHYSISAPPNQERTQ